MAAADRIRPGANPRHRVTGASRGRFRWAATSAFLRRPAHRARRRARRLAVHPAGRFYSGRPVFFNTSYVVSGDPTLDNPTRDKWFDTSHVRGAGHVHAAQQPVVLRRAERPGVLFADMTMTKAFSFASRVPARGALEAYNVFNSIIWDQPETNISSANFGKVTRKRVDGQGREIQIGVRFVF